MKLTLVASALVKYRCINVIIWVELPNDTVKKLELLVCQVLVLQDICDTRIELSQALVHILNAWLK